jgi:hypothetical protein
MACVFYNGIDIIVTDAIFLFRTMIITVYMRAIVTHEAIGCAHPQVAFAVFVKAPYERV